MTVDVTIRTITETAGLLGWIEAHPGLASWLQAFGSLAAIAVAVLVPYFSERRRKQALAERQTIQRERSESLILSVLERALAGTRFTWCVTVIRLPGTPEDAWEVLSRVDVCDAIERLTPEAEHLDQKAFLSFGTLVAAAREYSAEVSRYRMTAKAKLPRGLDNLWNRADDLQDAAEAMRGVLKAPG